jgi:hypothetical protein
VQRAEGRGQRAEGRGQRAEGRGQRAEGRGQSADCAVPTQTAGARSQEPGARRKRAHGNGRHHLTWLASWLARNDMISVPLSWPVLAASSRRERDIEANKLPMVTGLQTCRPYTFSAMAVEYSTVVSSSTVQYSSWTWLGWRRVSRSGHSWLAPKFVVALSLAPTEVQ